MAAFAFGVMGGSSLNGKQALVNGRSHQGKRGNFPPTGSTVKSVVLDRSEDSRSVSVDGTDLEGEVEEEGTTSNSDGVMEKCSARLALQAQSEVGKSGRDDVIGDMDEELEAKFCIRGMVVANTHELQSNHLYGEVVQAVSSRGLGIPWQYTKIVRQDRADPKRSWPLAEEYLHGQISQGAVHVSLWPPIEAEEAVLLEKRGTRVHTVDDCLPHLVKLEKAFAETGVSEGKQELKRVGAEVAYNLSGSPAVSFESGRRRASEDGQGVSLTKSSKSSGKAHSKGDGTTINSEKQKVLGSRKGSGAVGLQSFVDAEVSHQERDGGRLDYADPRRSCSSDTVQKRAEETSTTVRQSNISKDDGIGKGFTSGAIQASSINKGKAVARQSTAFTPNDYVSEIVNFTEVEELRSADDVVVRKPSIEKHLLGDSELNFERGQRDSEIVGTHPHDCSDYDRPKENAAAEEGSARTSTKRKINKACPVCRSFSSVSQTTLNVHIDSCLIEHTSVEHSASLDLKSGGKSEVSREMPSGNKQFKARSSGIKPKRKKRSIADIVASSSVRTLEDQPRNEDKVAACPDEEPLSETPATENLNWVSGNKKKRKPRHVSPRSIKDRGENKRRRTLTEADESKVKKREKRSLPDSADGTGDETSARIPKSSKVHDGTDAEFQLAGARKSVSSVPSKTLRSDTGDDCSSSCSKKSTEKSFLDEFNAQTLSSHENLKLRLEAKATRHKSTSAQQKISSLSQRSSAHEVVKSGNPKTNCSSDISRTPTSSTKEALKGPWLPPAAFTGTVTAPAVRTRTENPPTRRLTTKGTGLSLQAENLVSSQGVLAEVIDPPKRDPRLSNLNSERAGKTLNLVSTDKPVLTNHEREGRTVGENVVSNPAHLQVEDTAVCRMSKEVDDYLDNTGIGFQEIAEPEHLPLTVKQPTKPSKLKVASRKERNTSGKIEVLVQTEAPASLPNIDRTRDDKRRSVVGEKGGKTTECDADKDDALRVLGDICASDSLTLEVGPESHGRSFDSSARRGDDEEPTSSQSPKIPNVSDGALTASVQAKTTSDSPAEEVQSQDRSQQTVIDSGQLHPRTQESQSDEANMQSKYKGCSSNGDNVSCHVGDVSIQGGQPSAATDVSAPNVDEHTDNGGALSNERHNEVTTKLSTDGMTEQLSERSLVEAVPTVYVIPVDGHTESDPEGKDVTPTSKESTVGQKNYVSEDLKSFGGKVSAVFERCPEKMAGLFGPLNAQQTGQENDKSRGIAEIPDGIANVQFDQKKILCENPSSRVQLPEVPIQRERASDGKSNGDCEGHLPFSNSLRSKHHGQADGASTSFNVISVNDAGAASPAISRGVNAQVLHNYRGSAKILSQSTLGTRQSTMRGASSSQGARVQPVISSTSNTTNFTSWLQRVPLASQNSAALSLAMQGTKSLEETISDRQLLSRALGISTSDYRRTTSDELWKFGRPITSSDHMLMPTFSAVSAGNGESFKGLDTVNNVIPALPGWMKTAIPGPKLTEAESLLIKEAQHRLRGTANRLSWISGHEELSGRVSMRLWGRDVVVPHGKDTPNLRSQRGVQEIVDQRNGQRESLTETRVSKNVAAGPGSKVALNTILEASSKLACNPSMQRLSNITGAAESATGTSRVEKAKVQEDVSLASTKHHLSFKAKRKDETGSSRGHAFAVDSITPPEVIIIDDSVDSPAKSRGRGIGESWTMTCLLDCGALRYLPASQTGRSGSQLMEVDPSKIPQRLLHENFNILAELRKLGLVPAPKGVLTSSHRPSQSSEDHYTGSNPRAASDVLPPWLLAEKKRKEAQVVENLIVLDDDDEPQPGKFEGEQRRTGGTRGLVAALSQEPSSTDSWMKPKVSEHATSAQISGVFQGAARSRSERWIMRNL